VQKEHVRVVHLRAVVAGAAVLGLAEEEHAREGRDAEFRHVGPAEEAGIHVHDRLLPGSDDELVGPGDARAVQQGVECE